MSLIALIAVPLAAALLCALLGRVAPGPSAGWR